MDVNVLCFWQQREWQTTNRWVLTSSADEKIAEPCDLCDLCDTVTPLPSETSWDFKLYLCSTLQNRIYKVLWWTGTYRKSHTKTKIFKVIEHGIISIKKSLTQNNNSNKWIIQTHQESSVIHPWSHQLIIYWWSVCLTDDVITFAMCVAVCWCAHRSWRQTEKQTSSRLYSCPRVAMVTTAQFVYCYGLLLNLKVLKVQSKSGDLKTSNVVLFHLLGLEPSPSLQLRTSQPKVQVLCWKPVYQVLGYKTWGSLQVSESLIATCDVICVCSGVWSGPGMIGSSSSIPQSTCRSGRDQETWLVETSVASLRTHHTRGRGRHAPVCHFTCLSFHLFHLTCLSLHLTLTSPVSDFKCTLPHLSLTSPACHFTCLSLHLSVTSPVCHFTCLSLHLSACLSVSTDRNKLQL